MDEQPIRLMHYDPRWRQEFQQMRSSILHSCQGWVVAIEHIGSTAVSGIVSRPTIDAMAGVTSSDAFEPAANLIEGLNYRRVDSPKWAEQTLVLEKPRHLTTAEPTATHRVLLMELDWPEWTRAIRVRDWLRSHSEDAIRFEEAKVARWRSGEGDPIRYASDKAIFFAHLEEQIRADDQANQ